MFDISIEDIQAYFHRMPAGDKTALITIGIVASFALVGFLLSYAFDKEDDGDLE